MNWKDKLDGFWQGLGIGILFPMFCFFCYWLFIYSYMDFPMKFIKYLSFGQMLSNTIKMCALGNLLIFYLCINAKMNKASNGIITSVVLYAGLVFYIMYFHEHDL